MLHVVSQSPFSHAMLQRCLDLMQAGDQLLLIQDAVIAATTNHPHSLPVALATVSTTFVIPVAFVIFSTVSPNPFDFICIYILYLDTWSRQT